jgi:hypothetical protein
MVCMKEKQTSEHLMFIPSTGVFPEQAATLCSSKGGNT